MSRKLTLLPEPIRRNSSPFVIKEPGTWLILGDIHLPYHEPGVIELAVQRAIQEKVVGVILNGDILDCHELSRFDKTPDDPRYTEEVHYGRQFLTYLRERLPKARIVYKDGNHEERLVHYLISKAPALFGLDVLTIPSLLEFRQHNIEYVTDRRLIQLGNLYLVHGHEYRPAITAPVNPARGLFIRAKACAMTSHFHQVSEHHEPTIAGKPLGTWSIGCACELSPLYMPLNKWQHGFALVKLDRGGSFSVRNLRVIENEIL